MSFSKNSIIETNNGAIVVIKNNTNFTFKYNNTDIEVPYFLINYGKEYKALQDTANIDYYTNDSLYFLGTNANLVTTLNNPLKLYPNKKQYIFNNTLLSYTNNCSLIDNFNLDVEYPNNVTNYRLLSNSEVDEITEIQKELLYDSNNDIIHYITLSKIIFRFNYTLYSKIGINLPKTTNKSLLSTINVLIDYKFFKVNDTIRYGGFDILNNNISLSKKELFYTNSPYAIGFRLSTINHDNKYSTIYNTEDKTKMFNQFYLRYPVVNNQIEDFHVMTSSDGPAIIYRLNNNTQEYLYNNLSGLNTFNFYNNDNIKWHWLLKRNLINNKLLTKSWDLNSTGDVSVTDGRSFPIVVNRNNDISVSILSNDDETEYYKVYNDGNIVFIYYTIGGPLFTYQYSIQTNINKYSTLINIQHDDIQHLYILTTTGNLYLFAIFQNGDTYFNDVTFNDVNKIYGLYSDELYNDNLIIESNNSIEKILVSNLLTPYNTSIYSEYDIETNSYYMILKYNSSLEALESFNYIKKICKVIITNDGTYIPTSYFTLNNNIIRIKIDLLNYIKDNPQIDANNIEIRFLYAYKNLPVYVTISGFEDARQLSLGDLTFTFNGNLIDTVSPNTATTKVLHLKHDDITTGTFNIGCTGLMDNILRTELYAIFNNSNFYNLSDVNNSVNTNQIIVPNSGIFNKNLLSNGFINHRKRVDDRQYIIQGDTNRYSQVNELLDGNHNGISLVVSNKILEKATYYFPIITVYDDHKFIIGKIYDDNIVETDLIDNSDYNKKINRNDIISPSIESNDIYNISFNFRCAPNYIDYSTNKYTIYYENSTSLDKEDRVATPLISKWWIVGVPFDKLNIFQSTIIDAGSFQIESEAEPTHIQSHKDNYSFEHLNNNTLNNVYNSYITESNINSLITNVDSQTDGLVWCSGYFSTPSGYIDFNNVKFNESSEGSLISGLIPNNKYSIYFIVQDINDNKTGIDLIKLNSIYEYPVIASSFNY